MLPGVPVRVRKRPGEVSAVSGMASIYRPWSRTKSTTGQRFETGAAESERMAVRICTGSGKHESPAGAWKFTVDITR